MRRRWSTAVAVLACTVLVAGLAAPAGAARSADDVVLIGGLKHESAKTWTVIVSPPLARAGTPISRTGFVVTVDRHAVASSSRPHDPADLAVAIVVQAGVNAADLAAETSAASRAVGGLPTVTRAVVVASGTKPAVVSPLGLDRAAASAAISKIAAAPGASAVPAITMAAEALGDAPRKAILLFGPPGFATAEEIAAAGRSLVDQQLPLFVLSKVPAPKELQAVAVGSGGRAIAVGEKDTAGLLVLAANSVALQLAIQYLVTFTPPQAPSQGSRITVGVKDVSGSTAAVAKALLPSGGSGRSHKSQEVPWLLVGAAAAGVLLVLIVVVVVVRRRRRRRAGPAFRVPTTRGVIAKAEGAGDGEEPAGPEAAAVPPRHRPVLAHAARAGQVDEALDRLETFAVRWQPRSQGIFFAQEALAIHHRLGTHLSVTLDELTRATALDAIGPELRPVVRTVEALRWSLVRRSQGGSWADIAIEAAAVLRGELDPTAIPLGANAPAAPVVDLSRTAVGQPGRMRSRRGLEDEVPLREPVRAAAIARERVLEYQWFGDESPIVSRLLVPVLLYDRVPAAVPYLAVSRHLGDGTDVSTFYEAATAAADEATRRVIQLRALRSRYQAELDTSTDRVIELLFSIPVVTAGFLARRLDATAARVTELMDHLVSAGVVEALPDPTRRDDPAWIAVEVLSVFDRAASPVATISLNGADPAESGLGERATHRRRAAPTRPRQLRPRPRP